MTPSAPRVLIVDDEPNVRTCARLCLEEAGYRVDQAPNGADALEQIEQAPPDLVLLDLAMPVMDGMTVLAELRDAWQRSPSRVIVVTAHGSVKTAVDAMQLGAADMLEKPFTPDVLRNRVAAALNRAAEAPANAAGMSPPESVQIDVSVLLSEAGYRRALTTVRRLLVADQVEPADQLLAKISHACSERAAIDPAYLNLVGVVHEARGHLVEARSFYTRAIRVDRTPGYAPPRENSWRVYDVIGEGRSNIDVALGSAQELADAFPREAPAAPLARLKSPTLPSGWDS